MENLKILNKKETKAILAMLESQFGFASGLDYVFLMNNRDRVFIVNHDVSKIDFEKLRINSIGLYFGELRNNEIRLSIEGSQIIGPYASKNMLEISKEHAIEWLQGKDLDIDAEDGYKILKHNNDYIGCGRASGGKIINFVPKNRRLMANDPNV